MKDMPILKFDTFYGLRKGSLSYAHPMLIEATFSRYGKGGKS